MKILFLWAFLASASASIASTTRFACWRDIAMLDGVGTRAKDGSFPLPASCNVGVASAPPPPLSRAAKPVTALDETGTRPPGVATTPAAASPASASPASTSPASASPASASPASASPASASPASASPASSSPASVSPASVSPASTSPETTTTRSSATVSEEEAVETDAGNSTVVAIDEDPSTDQNIPVRAATPSQAEFFGEVLSASSENDADDPLWPALGTAASWSPFYDAAASADAFIMHGISLDYPSEVATLDTFDFPVITCALAWRRLESAGRLGLAVLCSMHGCTDACIPSHVVFWVITIEDSRAPLEQIPCGMLPTATPAPTAMTIASPVTTTKTVTTMMTDVRVLRFSFPSSSAKAMIEILTWISQSPQFETPDPPNNTTVIATNAVADESTDGSTILRMVTLLFAAVTVFWCTGCVFAARRPLRHGGRLLDGEQEKLSFWRRLLAVWSLGLVCGGCTILYLAIFIYAALWAWLRRGTGPGFVAILVIVALMKAYSIPLRVNRRGVPVARLSHPVIALWREYFQFSCAYDQGAEGSNGEMDFEDNQRPGNRKRRRRGANKRTNRLSKGQRRRRRVDAASQTFLVAQIPHGIMPFGALLGIGVLANSVPGVYPIGGVVADALLKAPILRRLVNWVGVRRASVDSIVGMFADGFKAVGVVTGGVAEMFFNWRTERIVAPRPNFAKIALQGGHHIIIVFVYGVSRTHRVTFGSFSATKKVGFPLLMGYGAFLNIPFREELKMVVSKPIAVRKVEEPTDDDVSLLRKRMEAELHRLYYCHRPEWESRPLHIVRGESSPAELEALEEKASASAASARAA